MKNLVRRPIVPANGRLESKFSHPLRNGFDVHAPDLRSGAPQRCHKVLIGQRCVCNLWQSIELMGEDSGDLTLL
jgi:hypothetical protein